MTLLNHHVTLCIMHALWLVTPLGRALILLAPNGKSFVGDIALSMGCQAFKCKDKFLCTTDASVAIATALFSDDQVASVNCNLVMVGGVISNKNEVAAQL